MPSPVAQPWEKVPEGRMRVLASGIESGDNPTMTRESDGGRIAFDETFDQFLDQLGQFTENERLAIQEQLTDRINASMEIWMAQYVPSLSMIRKAFPSLGMCIYCREVPGTTKEHIIPLALNGAWEIHGAACESCAKQTNQTYENTALQSDMLRVPRMLLGLKRRREKKKKPLVVPLAWSEPTYNLASTSGVPTLQLAKKDYPAVLSMLIIEPAGKLYQPNATVEPTRTQIRVWLRNIQDGILGGFVTFDEATIPDFSAAEALVIILDCLEPIKVSLRQLFHMRAFSKMLAKIAYCYAVAERGFSGFDGAEIRALLRG